MVKGGDTYGSGQLVDAAIMKKCPLNPYGNKKRRKTVGLQPHKAQPKALYLYWL